MKTKRFNSPDGFRFYQIKGKKYVSATTTCKVIPKSFLNEWYARMEKEAFMKVIEEFQGTKEFLKRLLQLANPKSETAAGKYIEYTSRFGNKVHDRIDSFFSKGKRPKMTTKQKRCFKQFLRWYKKSDIKPIKGKAEFVVFHKKMGVAGTVDLFAKYKGQTLVIDWKTGKSVYPDHFYQIVIYIMCAQSMGMLVKEGLIVHVPRDGGKAKAYPVIPGEGRAPSFDQVRQLVSFWQMLFLKERKKDNLGRVRRKAA